MDFLQQQGIEVKVIPGKSKFLNNLVFLLLFNLHIECYDAYIDYLTVLTV